MSRIWKSQYMYRLIFVWPSINMNCNTKIKHYFIFYFSFNIYLRILFHSHRYFYWKNFFRFLRPTWKINGRDIFISFCTCFNYTTKSTVHFMTNDNKKFCKMSNKCTCYCKSLFWKFVCCTDIATTPQYSILTKIS